MGPELRDLDPIGEPPPGEDRTAVTRRNMLVGVGLTSIAVVAGCSTYGDESAAPQPPAAARAGKPGKRGAGGNGGKGGKGAKGGGGNAGIVSVADVPVGGGVVLADQQLVVTQPSEGSFVGFSAVCTHAGCVVKDVSDGTINCPCHGSKFAVADGSVVDGPAPSPLPPVALQLRGTAIDLA
jgi:Rieske Fe-S protein